MQVQYWVFDPLKPFIVHAPVKFLTRYPGLANFLSKETLDNI